MGEKLQVPHSTWSMQKTKIKTMSRPLFTPFSLKVGWSDTLLILQNQFPPPPTQGPAGSVGGRRTGRRSADGGRRAGGRGAGCAVSTATLSGVALALTDGPNEITALPAPERPQGWLVHLLLLLPPPPPPPPPPAGGAGVEGIEPIGQIVLHGGLEVCRYTS